MSQFENDYPTKYTKDSQNSFVSFASLWEIESLLEAAITPPFYPAGIYGSLLQNVSHNNHSIRKS